MSAIRITESPGFNRDIPGLSTILVEGVGGPVEYLLTDITWDSGTIVRTYEPRRPSCFESRYYARDWEEAFTSLSARLPSWFQEEKDESVISV